VSAVPYGADGLAHLAYYDRGSLLSFVTDLNHITMNDNVATVGVHHGGYGEPLIDEFTLRLDSVDSIGAHFSPFTLACRGYVQAWRTSQRVEHFDGEAKA